MAVAAPIRRQAVRFAMVGAANTATCLALLWLLRDGLGWPVWLASLTGYAVAIGQSYLLNRGWTFAGAGPTPVGPQLARFLGVNLVVGLIFSALTSVLEPALGLQIASLAALLPVTILSFAAMRWLVFGARP